MSWRKMNSKILLGGFFANVVVLFFLGMLRRCLQLPSNIPNLLTAPQREWWEKNLYI